MGAAAWAAFAAIIGSVLASAVGVVGWRVQRRGADAQNWDAFNTKLMTDRDRAEAKQAAAEARAAAVEAQLAAAQAEIARLGALVTRLGGTP